MNKYTIRRNIFIVYPSLSLLLAFLALIGRLVSFGWFMSAIAVYEDAEGGYYVANNIPGEFAIFANYFLLGIVLLIGFPSYQFYAQWRERRQFKKKHGFTLPASKAMRFYPTIMLFGIIAVIYLAATGQEATFFESRLVRYLLAFWLIGIMLYLVARETGKTPTRLNSTSSQTNLELSSGLLADPGLISFHAQFHLNGRYQGVNIDHKMYVDWEQLKKKKFWSYPKMNVSCNIQGLAGGPSKKIEIVERKPRWIQFKGNDLEDCFQQRFEFKKGQPEMLSPELKAALLACPIHIHLILEKNNLIYQTQDFSLGAPYYSQEGVVLFWDKLLTWFEMTN